MIKKSVDYGKDLKGEEIWSSWCQVMSEKLTLCMPESVMKLSQGDNFSSDGS